MLLNPLTKIKEKYIFSSLFYFITCTTSFDLWMSCARYDIFVMVVSFINKSWEFTHVTINFFEM
jgi:hypothetical protein